MLTIHYFASIRESLKRDQDRLELPTTVRNVGDLIAHLAKGDPAFKATLDSEQRVLIAVNQTVVNRDCALAANDEIAFFPPMTGG